MHQKEDHKERGKQARGPFAQAPDPAPHQHRRTPGQGRGGEPAQDPFRQGGEQDPKKKAETCTQHREGASLAKPHPPQPQHLARVGLAEGMVRVSMKAVGVPRQAVDAPDEVGGDSTHRWMGRTTTAVP